MKEIENSPMRSKRSPYLGLGIVLIALIAILAVGTITAELRKGALTVTITVARPSPSPSISQQPSPKASPSARVSNGSYKNGEYSVVGYYVSPGGSEEVGVRLTLVDNIITQAVFEPKATRPISQKFQNTFNENYTPLVVGKNINEVQLDKVSGSSLTPKGFNDAVERIKAQAKV